MPTANITDQRPHPLLPRAGAGAQRLLRKDPVRAETAGTRADGRFQPARAPGSAATRSRSTNFAPASACAAKQLHGPATRKPKRPRAKSSCSPNRITKSSSPRTRACPNACCSPSPRRRATASRTPASSVSETTTARRPITPPTPPMTAGSSCRNSSRRPTSCISSSSP